MSERIGEGLVRVGAMTHAQMEEVLRRQRNGDSRLFGEIAIELGFINDQALQSYFDVKLECRFRGNCHFYGIHNKVASNERLKELYCENRPESCSIYQSKEVGKPIPITLWPTGMIAA